MAVGCAGLTTGAGSGVAVGCIVAVGAGGGMIEAAGFRVVDVGCAVAVEVGAIWGVALV